MAATSDSDDKKLQRVKSEIRSLLISCPAKSVLLNQFLRDYRNTIGKPVPFKEFNFNTPLQFLNSLTDVVKVVDRCGEAQLVAVINEQTSHINKMVEQQKKNFSNWRPSRKPHSHPAFPVNLNHYGYHQPVVEAYAQGQHIYYAGSYAYPPLLNRHWTHSPQLPTYGFTPQFGHPPPNAYYTAPNGMLRIETVNSVHSAYSSLNNANSIAVGGSKNKVNGSSGSNITFNVDKSTAPKANLRQTSLEQDVEDKRAGDPSKEDDNPRTVSNSFVDGNDHISPDIKFSPGNQDSTPLSVPEKSKWFNVAKSDFKSKIWDVLEKHSNGVPSSSFMNLYESLHSCSLDLASLGYSSLKEMVLKNEDVFSFEKPKTSDDWILYDARLQLKRRQNQGNQGSTPLSVPEKSNDFKSKIWDVLEKHTNGVPSSSFMNLYESLHSCSLDLASLGYSSLKEMVLKNEDVFSFEKPKTSDDWILYDARLQLKRRQNQGNQDSTPLSVPEKSNDFKSKIWDVLEKHTNGVPSSSFMNLYESLHSCSLDLASLGFSSLKEMVLKNEDVFSFEKPKTSDDWILYDARLKPKRRQNQVLTKNWIPHSVIDNLAALAVKYPNGVDADEILSLYKIEYSTEINPEILGFDSLHSLLESCKSILFKKYDKKGMVFPKDWVSRNSKQPEENTEPALPPIETMEFVWKDHFKENECGPSFKFKDPVIRDEKLLQVKIVDLNSPALIWIQFLDDVKSLNSLRCQMNIHYDREQEDYCIPENFVLPGLAVATTFEDNWHRALITSVEDDLAKIFYVDYGTTSTVMTSELRKLDKMFGIERVYAVKASLFCLVPYYGDEWSEESSAFLFSEYADKIVFAELCSVNHQDSFVEVILYDTSKGVDININDLLVSKNIARYVTNPVSDTGSILNERSISRFYKFLPRWFSMSDRRADDLDLSFKNLLLSTSGDSIPINKDVIPCCKLHCIQKLYQANSDALSLIWERAVRLEEERIFNNVITQVEDTLKEWGWDSCLTSELCCVNDPIEIHHRDDVNTEKSANDETPMSYLREPQPQRNGSTQFNNLSISRGSSITGVQTPGNRNIAHVRNDDTRWRDRPRLMYPRIIRYVDARVRGKILTLIDLKGEIRVSLYQLFKLTKLPSMLAIKRFELSNVDAGLMLVTRKNDPDLYCDLHELDLVTPDGDGALVLLCAARKVIRAIDPVGGHQDTFENLAKEVAPYLDKLIVS